LSLLFYSILISRSWN